MSYFHDKTLQLYKTIKGFSLRDEWQGLANVLLSIFVIIIILWLMTFDDRSLRNMASRIRTEDLDIFWAEINFETLKNIKFFKIANQNLENAKNYPNIE